MGSYKCAFHGNEKTIETAANRTSPNVVKCDTPVHKELPPFPTDTGKLMREVWLVPLRQLNAYGCQQTQLCAQY